MNVKQIVIKHLKANGYDGLYNENGECGCLIENLSPADCMTDQCCAGYVRKPTRSEQEDGYEWMITVRKPRSK